MMEEEARVRAKYPQKPNACALAQRRLAQAQSKKFFDSGDYNMAKATVKNSKLKASGMAEPNAGAQAVSESGKPAELQAAPEPAQSAETAKASETQAEVPAETSAKVDEKPKVSGLQSSQFVKHCIK